MLPRRDTVILDLDNTVWDWVDMWFRTTLIKLDGIRDVVQISDEELFSQVRKVHQTYGTSEYSFLFEELPCLQEKFGTKDAIREAMAETIRAFRKERKRALVLYPGVGDFLHLMKATGCKMAAFTESQAFYTFARFKHLGLDGVFDFLYTTEDVLHPDVDLGATRFYDPEYYKLDITIHRTTPKGALKPNAAILLSIIDEMQSSPQRSVYVGDSPYKDIPMAQKAGVLDALAEYGKAQHRVEYDLLRKVSHWTDEQVEREKVIHESGGRLPTLVLKTSIMDLVSQVELEGSLTERNRMLKVARSHD